MKKIILVVSIMLLLQVYACADEGVITVECNNELGKVNPLIFGNNLIAYDPNTYEKWGHQYYGYADYGAGMWDPKSEEPVQSVIALAKQAGISSLRFPGGCGAHKYNWKDSIGKKRIHFLFGLDEFLKVCAHVGAEPVITVSYFIGDEKDAADLVEYLNAPADGSNPNAGTDWAYERARNGHPQAYGVKYFEIGNEDWHGDHKKIRAVPAQEYGRRYLKYYDAMKAVDSSVQIGAIFCLPEWDEWDRQVASLIKEKIDFAIVHVYPAPDESPEIIPEMNPKDIFRKTLAMPSHKARADAVMLRSLLKETSGKNIPLAVTEYNGGFAQEKPVPYRHCLGTALANAELLRVMMQPDNNILMAHYWQFNNSYWGMVSNGFDGEYRTLSLKYFKRPNFYVYEFYRAHFAQILIQATTDEGGLSVNASKDQKKVYLMVINKNMDKEISATINLKECFPATKVKFWALDGPSIDATNEKKPDNVKVTYKEYGIQGNPFTCTFPAHSLTAIEIEAEGESK